MTKRTDEKKLPWKAKSAPKYLNGGPLTFPSPGTLNALDRYHCPMCPSGPAVHKELIGVEAKSEANHPNARTIRIGLYCSGCQRMGWVTIPLLGPTG